uniref:NADH-ubiquinone oxidoreductase chain 2 n=1 Tax=Gasteruption sp. M19 TaxID=162239 RepID=A0A096XMX1_9HYME|nr:NADH dehydrogenase subunit 2 [Gasteruption sp. M19]
MNNINLLIYLFMIMMFLSIFFSFTFLNMLGVYMMMELNMISYLPLLIYYNYNNKTEIVFIYYIIQSVGSMMFLFNILIMMFCMNYYFNKELMLFGCMISLFIKLGCVPFHFWYLMMMKNMSWLNCYLLSTVQKLMPMLFLYQFINNYLYLGIFMCSLLSVFSLNEVSLRMIMAYSSINHMSWMIMGIMHSFMVWFIYFFIYMILMFFLISLLNYYNIYYINQILFCMNGKLVFYLFSLYIFSLGGMPPFMGFYMKWFVMDLMINNLFILMFMVMILGSMIMLFSYIRLMYMYMLFYKSTMIVNIYMFYLGSNMHKYYFIMVVMLYMGLFMLMMGVMFLF